MGPPTKLTQSLPLRQILVRLWPFTRGQRGLMLGASVCLVLEVGLRLLEPWPLKLVFDRLFAPALPALGQRVGSPGLLDRLSPETALLAAALAVIAIAAARAGSSYLRRVGFSLAGSGVLSKTRAELFAHLQRLSLSFHHRNRAGDLITRVTADIGRVKEVAITAVLPLLAHGVTLLGMLVVMTWMDWRLSAAALAIMPLMVLATGRLGSRIRRVARQQRKRGGDVSAAAAEVIGSIKVVQAMSLEEVHSQTFSARNRDDIGEGVKAQRLSAKLVGISDILISVGTALVLWFGARRVTRGVLTPGDLIVFLSYLRSAFRPLRDMARYTGRISKAAASAERILEVLDTTPKIRNRPGAVSLARPVETVRFADVTFAYEEGRTALSEVSFEIARDEVLALAGPSGAGKSTIVHLLLRLWDPDRGSILVNGRDIRDYRIESLRSAIGVVPQENVLFQVSVRDNIAYGAPGVTEKQVFEAARIARAHEFICALPRGYDTVVGERGQLLSDGQRQRIAIARAVVRAAPILVLDEPTSSLDQENSGLIREALRELRSGRVTILVAHDLSTVQGADQILFLDRGRVIERGTHAELLALGGRYATAFRLQRSATSPALTGIPDAVGA